MRARSIRWAAVALLALGRPRGGRAPRRRRAASIPRQISPLAVPDPAASSRRWSGSASRCRATGRRRPRSAPSAGAAASSSTPSRATLLTVSYVLLDAARIEVDAARRPQGARRGWSGSTSRSGVGVARLEGRGPVAGRRRWAIRRWWRPGTPPGTVGVSDDGDLVATPSRVQAVRPFAAAWEYMLDRAFIVAPVQRRVRRRGARRRGGPRDRRHLAAPGRGAPRQPGHPDRASSSAGKDELLAKGRVDEPRAAALARTLHASRWRAASWWPGMSPLGPARAAGLRPGDVIVQLNGQQVASREEFYRELWQAPMDQDVQVTVRRAGATRGDHGPPDGPLPFLSDLRHSRLGSSHEGRGHLPGPRSHRRPDPPVHPLHAPRRGARARRPSRT